MKRQLLIITIFIWIMSISLIKCTHQENEKTTMVFAIKNSGYFKGFDKLNKSKALVSSSAQITDFALYNNHLYISSRQPLMRLKWDPYNYLFSEIRHVHVTFNSGRYVTDTYIFNELVVDAEKKLCRHIKHGDC